MINNGPSGSFLQYRVVGEPEVVVGAEVEHPPAVRQFDMSALCRSNETLGLEKPLLAEVGEPVGEVSPKAGFHEQTVMAQVRGA